MIYCIVPRELAPALHDVLRAHFADDEDVEVVVELREASRRQAERRGPVTPASVERRLLPKGAGRRVGDRRAPTELITAPALPPEAQAAVERLAFVRQLRPTDDRAEDVDSARLVRAFQRGDQTAFTGLYMRYFDRVYAYMRVVLTDNHAAEDATQQVFLKLFESLDRYQERGRPFRAFLFTVVRNHAVSELRKRSRLETLDPEELDQRRSRLPDATCGLGDLDWVSDRTLTRLIERLPIAQRQVLLLRFMLDLPHNQVAEILARSPEDVRALQYRALTFLRARLASLETPHQGGVQRMPMRRRHAAQPVARARRAALAASH